MRDVPLDENDGLIDEQVDRLVDGELTLAEQRALIEQLEASPNGWRRVGLAFLEAQALRQACHHLTVTIPETMPAAAATKDATLQTNMTRMVTTAAAILVAFALGLCVEPPWSSAITAVPTVAQVEPSADLRESASNPVVETVPVSIGYGNGAFSEPVPTPVVNASSPEGQAWLRSSPGVSDRLRELLRRHGQKLQERQEWVEIDLADGRRGYLPVQEWTVSPVSLADFR